MSLLNNKQLLVIWALLIVLGATLGVMRPNLSNSESGFQLGAKSVVSMYSNSKRDVKKRATYLHEIFSGKQSQDLPETTRPEEDVSNAVSFRSIGNRNEDSPFVSAIVSEGGASSVYIRRGKEKAQILKVGDSWRGWTIEVIEPSRVYFSNVDEDFDYLVFATIGNNK